MLDISYYEKTDQIIAQYSCEEKSLIPIIQGIQEEYRYLPPELLTYVAGKLGISEAKAYSVASFYENFSGVILGCTSSLTITAGASPHAPRHETVSTVNSWSSVVCFFFPSPSSL